MHWIQRSRLILIIIIVSLIAGCASTPTRNYVGSNSFSTNESQPKNIGNICAIFLEKPHWYVAASRSSQSTGASIQVMMAIMYQESSFKSNVRPISKKTGKPLSTAYGYAQALTSTWKYYQGKVGIQNAKRDRFDDSINFIGWYVATTAIQNKVPMHRADQVYLNYHEGWGGYKRKTHHQKPWLLDVSNRVQARSQEYSFQLASCERKLQNIAQQTNTQGDTPPKPTQEFPRNDEPPANKTYPVRWF